jgi:Protein of unknown function (DUF2721)
LIEVEHQDIARLIQSALAPVFLISGVASTLAVLTNRLSRAVDRARGLEKRLDQGGTEPPLDLPEINAELRVLARRASCINAAITLCGVSAMLVTLVVVVLFANAFFGGHMAIAIAVLFVGSMLFLTAAFIAFLVEVRLATRALRIGLREHAAMALARSRQTEKSAKI